MADNCRLSKNQLKFLNLLSKNYKDAGQATTEIINLQAILNLPKGTEHFLADIHGESEPFQHVLKNASGVIKDEIERKFGNSLNNKDKKCLATLIYYPEQKLEIISKQNDNLEDFYKITLYRLIEICRSFSSGYTRSKVRKAIPKNFNYIIEELLQNDRNEADKIEYYSEIVRTIIDIDCAREFIIALSKLIQDLAIDRLHIIGDIFDRGPHPDTIIDILMKYHAVDIQWGNHDILWMGAASGSECCIANVLRISLRYGNLETLENGYGVNLLPLATFAMENYGDDPCEYFLPKITAPEDYDPKRIRLMAQMHKAIAILQFKLEAAVIRRHPEYQLDSRLLLDKIDFENNSVHIGNKNYPLRDTLFETVDRNNPFELTNGEKKLIKELKFSFLASDKLNLHCRFLLSNGSMYRIFNSNLLYHGCIPLNRQGNLRATRFDGKQYKGRALLDYYDEVVRNAFFSVEGTPGKQELLDKVWYLWNGPYSPLFGKAKMATFERYFIKDKSTHFEAKNAYYTYRDNEESCDKILKEFGLDPKVSHIINGHVPVEQKNGESPIKAGGKLIVIDGGFSKSYQHITGIAGYTLIYDSYGLTLVSHEPFVSTEKAISEEKDILSSAEVLEQADNRIRVKDTDIGTELKQQIEDLKLLLNAYRKGIIIN